MKGKKKMRKFTTQEVIDMGAELYDNKGFDRATIRAWLKILNDTDMIDVKLSADSFESLYDLIVG